MDATKSKHWVAAVIFCLGLATSIGNAAENGLGQILTDTELAAWNIDVFPDGTGLPLGEGSVVKGKAVYENMCLSCHGAKLEGGFGPALAGGNGSLATAKPQKTVGSYWPYSSTLFDYIRRAMPFQAPQSLSNEDVFSVSGYILHVNGLMAGNAIVNAKTLIEVKMPNRDGFYEDNRPDGKNPRCMQHCSVKSITTQSP